MNYKMIRKILGKVLMLEGILMLFPLFVALICKESTRNILSFLLPILVAELIGLLLRINTKTESGIQAKEGFVIVGLSWIIMAVLGAIPFMISLEIPNFFNAFFEISSGFTTTGASILTNIESLSKSTLLWRSFSNWIGGMGMLVFILAIIPESNNGSTIYLLRAESPGPMVNRLVSKLKSTARLLYLIYIALTILEFAILLIGGTSFFNSLTLALSTAGTGGFSILNDSLASCSIFCEYVVAIFMLIFGINFSIFYLLLIKKVKLVFKNEELKVYLGVVIVSIMIICINCYNIYGNFELTFRNSLFQVASIISTTGFTTADYTLWPSLSKMIILLLMLFGACAGSTAGGLKISRVIILFKTTIARISNVFSPRKIKQVKYEGSLLTEKDTSDVLVYFAIYVTSLVITTILISIDGKVDLITNLSASIACLSNIGPGFGLVGPMGNYSIYTGFSKLVLSLTMILGRLELYPMLILLHPRTWTKGNW